MWNGLILIIDGKNGIVEYFFKESLVICMEWIVFIVEYYCYFFFLKGFVIGYFSQDGVVFEQVNFVRFIFGNILYIIGFYIII